MGFPRAMADHGGGLVTMRWQKAAALYDSDSKRLKVIRTDLPRANSETARPEIQRFAIAVRCDHLVERAAVLEQVPIDEILIEGIDVPALVGPAERDEPGRGDAFRRLSNKAVRNGKDGRVAADDQCDERDRRGAQPRRRGQDAAARPNVLEKLLEGRPRPDGARIFFRQRDVAQRAAGVRLRVLGRLTPIFAEARFFSDVKLDFGIDVFCTGLAAKPCHERSINP